MTLAQDIVIRNQFTSQQHTKTGSTPGSFVLTYASRADATDTMTPLQHGLPDARRLKDFAKNYVARASATEQAAAVYALPARLEHDLAKADARSGRAFGSLGLSYKGDVLEHESSRIQKLFDKGHTVLKMVISFTESYLKRMGLVPPDFQVTGRGAYRGQVDQLKMREALNNGLSRMTKRAGFEKPVWVGAVQVDTKHVHAHVVLAEAAATTKRALSDGEERGKLWKPEKQELREGIHHSLLDLRPFHGFHRQVENTRQDVVGHVRSLVYNEASTSTKLQRILAALPENRSWWRWKSRRREMRHPNRLLAEYLAQLARTKRGVLHLDRADAALTRYANARQKMLHLSRTERDELYQNGRAMLRERMANGIYRELRDHVARTDLTVHSPLLVHQSESEDGQREAISRAFSQSGGDPNQLRLTLFSYRLSSYRRRLDEHMESAREYENDIREFDEADRSGKVDPTARVMQTFYFSERRYHMLAGDKYRTFFPLDGRVDDLRLRSEGFSARSGYLGREYARLSTLMPKGDSEEAVSGVARRMLDDARLQPVFGLAGNAAETESVGDVLNRLSQNTESFIPERTVLVLNAVGKSFPEYKGSGDRLVASQMASPISSAVSADYRERLDRLAFDGWEAGLLPATDVPGEPERSAIAIPKPVIMRPRRTFLTPSYFDEVKGVDLADILYDLGPEASRHVDRKARDEYSGLVESRLSAAVDATIYLRGTGQDASRIARLVDQLKRERELAEQIEKTKELPLSMTPLTQPTDQEDGAGRLAASVTLDEANRHARQHIQLISETSDSFAREIDEEAENDQRDRSQLLIT